VQDEREGVRRERDRLDVVVAEIEDGGLWISCAEVGRNDVEVLTHDAHV